MGLGPVHEMGPGNLLTKTSSLGMPRTPSVLIFASSWGSYYIPGFLTGSLLMHLHRPGKAGRSMGASRELHILPRTLESLWVHTCPHLPLECVWQFCCPSRSLGHGPLCWAPELPFVPWLSLGAAQCPVLWGWPSWMSWRRSNCRLTQPVWAAS